MTITLTDERTKPYPDSIGSNLYIGAFDITKYGTGNLGCGPDHVEVNDEHYRYEQYQAHTLWGLRKMNRREITAWRIKQALRRPV